MTVPWKEQENRKVSSRCLKTASDGADATWKARSFLNLVRGGELVNLFFRKYLLWVGPRGSPSVRPVIYAE